MTADKPTVIVTGSSGLIGYAVASAFADRFRTMGFDRAGPPRPPPAAECVSVDLTADDSVQRGLEHVRRPARGSPCPNGMLNGATAAGQWNGFVAGLLVIALALPRGRIRERYGAWQSWIL